MLSVIETEKLWEPLAKNLVIPHDEAGYKKLVQWLDVLIDEVGENEQHPLASLMEILGILIEQYEDENVPELF
jgi:HTH-type transcriptional regulator/antitoxin HigA